MTVTVISCSVALKAENQKIRRKKGKQAKHTFKEWNYLSVLQLNGSKLFDTNWESSDRSWDTSVFLKKEKHIIIKNSVTQNHRIIA